MLCALDETISAAKPIDWIRVGASCQHLNSDSRIEKAKRGSTVKCVEQFVEHVSSWPGVSVHPHQFGGREFKLGNAEIGHVHCGGIIDIPFPRTIRDALLEEQLAEEHYWVPNSGWTTFCMRSDFDLEHALWLMGLSYLRYQLRTAPNASGTLQSETEQLLLSPRFISLLSLFVRKSEHKPAVHSVSA